MRRFGTLLSFALATAAITAGAIGCNGPISDWPPKAGDDSAGPSGIPIQPSKPVGSADAGAAGPGGSVGANSGGAVGGTTGGGMSTPGILGGLGGTDAGSSAPGGGFLGGSDAGSVRPMDSGSPPTSADASAPPEAGTNVDPDAGAPDAGDGGGEGGCNIVPTDAGVVPGDDAGLCAAYGCGVTLDSLSKLVTTNGACTTAEALPFVCSGALSRAALQCTQDNALSLSLGRAVSSCVRRLPQLAKVPVPCQQCYVDETLCTLSRCFAACIDGRDPACQQCRLQACGSAFTTCAGVPTPAQTMF